jgi:hypothetical protein
VPSRPESPSRARTFEQTLAALDPPCGFSLAEFKDRIAEVVRGVCPVVYIVEGSGRLEPVGTAFVVGDRSDATIITAEHVVKEPQATAVMWPSRDLTLWPDRYLAVRPRGTDGPDADIALLRGAIDDEAEIECIPVHRLEPDLLIRPRRLLVAVGLPASLGEVTEGRCYNAHTFHIIGWAQDVATLPGGALDPRVHLAMRYDPATMRELSGAPRRGVKPVGMSGGVALALASIEHRGVKQLVVDVVGVLVAFRPKHGILIATRLACLAAAMRPADGPFRLVEVQRPGWLERASTHSRRARVVIA